MAASTPGLGGVGGIENDRIPTYIIYEPSAENTKTISRFHRFTSYLSGQLKFLVKYHYRLEQFVVLSYSTRVIIRIKRRSSILNVLRCQSKKVYYHLLTSCLEVDFSFDLILARSAVQVLLDLEHVSKDDHTFGCKRMAVSYRWQIISSFQHLIGFVVVTIRSSRYQFKLSSLQ